MHVHEEFIGVIQSDLRVLEQYLEWVRIGVKDSIGPVVLKKHDPYLGQGVSQDY